MALFADNSAGTFADTWYRAADTKPRISVHARFVRQRHGPTVSYVIDDPAGGHYYRLTESARFFLGLLDGRRTVDEAWEACLAQLGDDAPTQRECLDLLAQMQLFGLIVGDQPIAPDMVPERHNRFRQQRLRQRTGNWMFYNIPLLNPEPALRALAPYLRAFWGWPGFLAWLVLSVSAIGVAIAHADQLVSSFNGFLDPRNLIWLSVLFMLIRAVHELGHAMACKAMGGRCTEIGVMLIGFLLPLPYCDASSSWKFPETWKRVLVACGGMLIETFFASIATFIWAFGEEGLMKALAFNAMVISSVSTIMFNANPLLRYDGYYILCDVAGAPNLAQRARQTWFYLIQRFAFGIPNVRPPYVRDRSEFRLLLTYQLLSMPYRMLVTFSILMLIASRYLSLGLVLAAVFGAVWLIWPVLQGMWFMLTSPVLLGRRSRSIGVVASLLIPLIVLVGIIPLPASSTLPGVVESVDFQIVRADSPGYVESVLAVPGEAVRAGDVLIVMKNPSYEADARAARARAAYAQATLDDAASRGAAALRIALARYERAVAEVDDVERQLEALTVRANIGGTFAAGGGSGLDIENLDGRFLDRGVVIGVVLPNDSIVVRAAVTDTKAGNVVPVLTQGHALPQIRIPGESARVIDGTVSRVWPAGSRQIESMQFSAITGGDLLTNPHQTDQAIESFTLFDIKPESDKGLLPGRRAKVRIRLEPSTLFDRAVTRVRQYFDGRVR
ncbi:MAG: PqqD family peptide modification chaperone [Phycisphaerales bacterium]|nr:PqqD family peptide modification chaperone [Phycisphaerales bacterium]MCB9836283.1 PqqD family peptide modification chaperone [Phycisphaera sp.]